MIPKEYIGKTITTKYKSKNGKKEYTVTCHYPDEEHTKIINERLQDFYIKYLQSKYKPKELEFIVSIWERCCELEKQGFKYDEMEKIIIKECEEKGLIKTSK